MARAKQQQHSTTTPPTPATMMLRRRGSGALMSFGISLVISSLLIEENKKIGYERAARLASRQNHQMMKAVASTITAEITPGSPTARSEMPVAVTSSAALTSGLAIPPVMAVTAGRTT